jgi:hypothetical protein
MACSIEIGFPGDSEWKIFVGQAFQPVSGVSERDDTLESLSSFRPPLALNHSAARGDRL